MSLIYQALKQTEQEAPAAVVASAAGAAPRTVPVVPPAASGLLRGPLLLGAVVASAGIVAGLLLSQREPAAGVAANAAPSAPAAVAPAPADMPPLPTAPVAPLPVAAPDASPASVPGALAALPLAEPPLPTVPPRLTLSTSLSVRPAAATTESTPAVAPPPAAVSAPVPGAAPAPAQPVSQARPAPVEVTVRATGGATEGASNEDISELFDGLNRALEARDEAQAQRHLQGIRNRLPEGSLARLRAEGWHAYRTGDAERAQRVYRRLLEKLPGDENASLTLASIERQGQRPDQAREVLARSLRHNPNSTVLRAALDQASQTEATR